MPTPNSDELDYAAMGIAPPESIPHMTEEQIRASLVPLDCRNWRMEGNQLICDTEHGILAQTLPTDIICRGTDEQGKPILTKIEI